MATVGIQTRRYGEGISKKLLTTGGVALNLVCKSDRHQLEQERLTATNFVIQSVQASIENSGGGKCS